MAGRRTTAPVPPEMVLEEGDSPLAPPEVFPTPVTEDRQRVEEVVSVDQVTELTEEERGWFSALLTCGRRHKIITVMGDHKVAIQTLNADDDLRIGLYTKAYKDSDSYSRAYQIAVCAAGIRTIDNRPLYQPITEGEDEQAVFIEKVERMSKFYPVVITDIYRSIMELDGEFAELARKLGKLTG
jgi:hypothetical protein